MELVLLAGHNLKLLSDLGGVSAVPRKFPGDAEAWHVVKPDYVRHGSVNNYRRCRLTARFFCNADGTALSSANEVLSSNGGNAPVILLLPLGRDPVENSGVITFKLATEGPLLSRRHCVLQLSSSHVLRVSHDPHEWCAISVRDCCSLNGTFVNGCRLAAGASSLPVAFDPCDARWWKEPLLTLELGAGAKLAPGASLSERQLLLRLHVFVRFIGERQDVGWVQHRLQGPCFSKLAAGDAAPGLSSNDHSVCRLSAASTPVNLTTEVLGKELCGSYLQSEEGLDLPCGVCGAAAQRIVLLHAGSTDSSVNGLHPCALPQGSELSSRQCLCSTSLIHHPECGVSDNNAVESTLRSVSVNSTTALPRYASGYLVKRAEEKCTTTVKEYKAASLTNRRVRESLCDSSVGIGLAARDVVSKTPLGGIEGKHGDCAPPRRASTHTGPMPHSLLASHDDGGNPSNPLKESLLDLSPVLVRASLAEPQEEKCSVVNSSRSVSLSASAQCKEENTTFSPTAAPVKVVNVPNSGMTAEKDELVGESEAMRRQLVVAPAGVVQVLSWRSGSCSLPTSQDDMVIGLPRRGIVKVKVEEEDELVVSAGPLTMSASPPPCDLALGGGPAKCLARTTRKRVGKRRRVLDSKETVKMFIAELLDDSVGASLHKRN
ncbi:putative helicase ARIP4 isoform X3 [Trypanosoma rangeli]|uniref:Putative helicase ARIP4 isoform X3 n=1 Tax=Trypanosoma rangeli TaxID=5698 RepID=A0A3R7MT38_TRYRA|nr:putative helicase ARIP4 isoform X3 [Trypanosoma rangeli]RNF07688.1 putative helicase ARIP4 isoform X3 [Trypanosoma rangeli]|eukprot:RNF07688.1 putative helicase ARIP4 isoform X3 [Trypanosoma rangeli]